MLIIYAYFCNFVIISMPSVGRPMHPCVQCCKCYTDSCVTAVLYLESSFFLSKRGGNVNKFSFYIHIFAGD